MNNKFLSSNTSQQRSVLRLNFLVYLKRSTLYKQVTQGASSSAIPVKRPCRTLCNENFSFLHIHIYIFYFKIICNYVSVMDQNREFKIKHFFLNFNGMNEKEKKREKKRKEKRQKVISTILIIQFGNSLKYMYMQNIFVTKAHLF